MQLQLLVPKKETKTKKKKLIHFHLFLENTQIDKKLYYIHKKKNKIKSKIKIKINSFLKNKRNKKTIFFVLNFIFSQNEQQ